MHMYARPGRLQTAARRNWRSPAVLVEGCRLEHNGDGRMASQPAARAATSAARPSETEISVSVNLDGTGAAEIATGVGFFDHMLDQLVAPFADRHGGQRQGRPPHRRPPHGRGHRHRARPGACRKALGERRGIVRYASLDLAMDETLTRAARRCFRPSLPGLERRLHRAQDRHVRHRAGARILPGARPECRHHPACHQPLRRQQPPYRRDLLQGGGAGRCVHALDARSAPGRTRCPPPRAV